ncbi:MAG: TSUP family transporter [Clostridia bacterium]|nr:TSUP family transporter [Clostridia bacterium]
MEAEKQTRTAQGSPEGGGSAGEKRANLAVGGGEESTNPAVSGGEESTKSAAGTGEESTKSAESGGEESAKPAAGGGEESAKSAAGGGEESTKSAAGGGEESTKSAAGTGEKKRATLDAPLAFRLIAVGMTAGVINGVFGTGGGTVIVFALSALAGRLFPDRRMIFANAIAIILPPAVVSTLVYASFSPPDPTTVTAIALCSLAGGALGALLLGKLKGRVLRLIFAVLMILSGGIMLFR